MEAGGIMQLNDKKREVLVNELNNIKQYLVNNKRADDAQRIEKIIYDITNSSSDKAQVIHALKRFIAMSSVRYLGDITITEFDSPYDWMNYLSNTAKLAEELILSVKK
ncbi:MAG: hypothetical protein K0S80_4197 [Neobacillus sp.]|jgi:hypothetical protein|nr:hypothetical protein [Neobacillus sp.]